MTILKSAKRVICVFLHRMSGKPSRTRSSTRSSKIAHGLSRVLGIKLGIVLFGYRERVGSIMNYVIGLIAGAVIGGAIGYLGNCAGST